VRSVTELTEGDLGRTIRVQGRNPMDNVEGEVVRARFEYEVDGCDMMLSILYHDDIGEFLDGDVYGVVE